METLLFNQEKVRKFFDILSKLGRAKSDLYGGECERAVFVRRTISEKFSGKYLILYTDTGIKRYLLISNIRFGYGYGDDLKVSLFDYSNLNNPYSEVSVSYNDAIGFEGEWCKDSSKHDLLVELCTMVDVPSKKYYFEGFDFTKYPKRKKKGQTEEDIKNLMRFDFVVEAKTRNEAYEKAKIESKKLNKVIIDYTVKKIE